MIRPLVPLVAGAMLLLGCSAPAAPVVEPDELSLADTVVVLAAAPPFESLVEGDGGRDGGLLLLVDAEGSVQQLTVPAIDLLKTVERDGTLYFSDASADRLVGSTTARTERRWREYTHHFIAATDSGYTSVFNSNADAELGYVFDVSVGDADGAVQHRVPGFFEATAVCATGVHAVSVDAERQIDVAAPRRLLHLDADDGPRTVATWTPSTAVVPITTGACEGSELVLLAEEFADGAQEQRVRASIVRWDVGSTVPELVPLRSPDGSDLPAEMTVLQHAETTVHDGSLWWIGPRSTLLRSDLRTGETVAVTRLQGHDDESASNVVAFEGDEVVHLVVPASGDALLTRTRLGEPDAPQTLTIGDLRATLGDTEVTDLTLLDTSESS